MLGHILYFKVNIIQTKHDKDVNKYGYQLECDSNHEFQCVNIQRCIKKSWKCDGINDCGDNSDEFGCEVIHGMFSRNLMK